MSRAGWAGTVVIGAASLSNCLPATEIELVLSTNVPCASVRSTAIAVGVPGDDQSPIVTSTTQCSDDGGIGSFVVLPSGSFDDTVALRVTLGVNAQADQCNALNSFSGCVVARRELRWSPHTPLTLPILLEGTCIDRPCDSSSSCDNGLCVPLDAGSCDDANVCTLPPVDAGVDAPPIEAGTCVDSGPPLPLVASLPGTPHIAKTTAGYVVSWKHLDSTSHVVIEVIEVDATGKLLRGPFVVANGLGSDMVLGPVGSEGSNYAVLFSTSIGLTGLKVDQNNTQTANATQPGLAAPLAGLFFDGTRLFFGAASSANVLQLSFSSSFTGGSAALTGSWFGVGMTHSTGSTQYLTAHDAFGNCGSGICTPSGTDYVCSAQPSTPNCTSMRIVSNGTDRLTALNQGTLSAQVSSHPPITLGQLDFADAFEPLVVGSAFRVIWREPTRLMTATFDATTTAAQSTALASLSGSLADVGFDAVADGAGPAYAVVFYNPSNPGNVYFLHRCQ